MTSYLEYTIPVQSDTQREILLAELAHLGFEGFEEKDTELLAYIPCDLEPDIKAPLDTILTNIIYKRRIIAPKNWNKEWESSIQPLLIDDFVCIRTAFHPFQGTALHEIIITPKMSFGTGHHHTTASLLRLMKKIDFTHKKVLDFGAGTGILGILACHLGASKVVCMDNDPLCIDNMLENKEVNNCEQMDIVQGAKLPSGVFDVVLCNIHLNFMVHNLSRLCGLLEVGGVLLISGFYLSDVPIILDNLHQTLAKERCRINMLESEEWIGLSIHKV